MEGKTYTKVTRGEGERTGTASIASPRSSLIFLFFSGLESEKTECYSTGKESR
jgi:hypothetical protein